MNNHYISPIVLAIAVFTGACSSTPTITSSLDQARSDYRNAQGSASVTRYAPLELKQAGDALEQANAAAARHDSTDAIDKLAYIARQKIALSVEVTKQKLAEAEVEQSGRERDQVRIEQRTAEANQSKLIAQSALAVATDANRDANLARTEAAASQRKAQEAQDLNAQLEAQLFDLAAKKTERGIVITLGDVLFGTDMARLTPDGMRTAQKLATVLQQNPQRTVLIEGFTDSTGTTTHNQELSERRANVVRSALLEQGVAAERIATRGFGESYPVAANETAADRQLNRRVEIVLSDDKGIVIAR